MPKIKPCTCGGDAQVHINYFIGGCPEFLIQCEDCDKATPIFYSEEAAVNAWNTFFCELEEGLKYDTCRSE